MLKSILPILQMFSGPIGNLINTAIIAGSAASITWMTTQGVPLESAQGISSGVILIGASLINGLTGTQLVKINDIRDDKTNGVTVVSAKAADKAGIPRVNEPQNMG